MESDPQISIIVPVYNVSAYLPECINSILNQKFKNLEIILVDDGSTDSSGIICDDFMKKDSRIVVIHKKNGGLSSARNAGIQKARGKYIGFVDGDDWISCDMYGELYRIAESTQAQITSCRCLEVTGDSSSKECAGTSSIVVLESSNFLKKLFRRKIKESVCDKIFSRELFKEIRFPEAEINEDTPVLVKLIMESRKTALLDRYLYYYRMREGSITKSGYSEQFRVVDKHIMEIEKLITQYYPEVSAEMKYFFGVHYYCLILSILKDKNKINHMKDYQYYLHRFRNCFVPFMKWGTGKSKDRLLAILLILRCGPLIYGGFR